MRRDTLEIKVGNIVLGGNSLIKIQSMTNTNTLDTNKTTLQTIQLFRAGCDLVRITTPSVREAENLINIKNSLKKQGFEQPLIADIHFNSSAAEIAARIVGKIRINPGNYADKKQFKQFEYTEVEYQNELNRILERIKPLISICNEYGTAIRIGVNQGSLSDRIINRYGNTALGMAYSALEYAQICNNLGFNNLVFSMKSSDVKTMVYSTRLLVKLLDEKKLNYPIHLGVTEAGADEDGRIKSIAGITSLLEDGIGDTLRVSLTENPINEIKIAKKITDDFNKNIHNFSSNLKLEYSKRKSININNLGANNKIKIVTNYINKNDDDISITNFQDFNIVNYDKNSFIDIKKINYSIPILINSDDKTSIVEIKDFIINELSNIELPIILSREYENLEKDQLQYNATKDFAFLLIDGLIDGIEIKSSLIDSGYLYKLSLDILQSCGVRYYKTEFISCPSCGRTQFDIEELLRETKNKLSKFKNLKIGVMGCIVNGPGEMLDADYGLVGAGDNKVWIYKGKNPILKNIQQEIAVEKLKEIIENDLNYN